MANERRHAADNAVDSVSVQSPRSGVAFPETNAAHLTCMAPFDGSLRELAAHEANHVIMQNSLGRPGTAFMNEGLANALMSPALGDSGQDSRHFWVRNNRSRVVPVATFIDDSKWDGEQQSYNSSGSFLTYLLERYGAAKLKQLYHTHSSEIAQRLADVYGKSIEALQAEWLAAI